MCHDEAKKHVWEQMVIKFSVNAAGSSLARARARSPRICRGRLDYARRRRRAVKTLSRLARTTRVRSEQPATAEQQRPAAVGSSSLYPVHLSPPASASVSPAPTASSVQSTHHPPPPTPPPFFLFSLPPPSLSPSCLRKMGFSLF